MTLKRTLLAASAVLMAVIETSAQEITPTSSENWILHTVYSGINGDTTATDITYYNGLGFKEQHIQVSASMNGKSVVKPFGKAPRA